jgi:hypothetical protein
LLSHLRSCERYDEPETLPSSICQFCLTSADGGQSYVDIRFELISTKGEIKREISGF